MLSSNELAHRLRERIAQEYRERSDHLSRGLAADHADYRHRCGYLLALRDMESWIGELVREINEQF